MGARSVVPLRPFISSFFTVLCDILDNPGDGDDSFDIDRFCNRLRCGLCENAGCRGKGNLESAKQYEQLK